MQRGHALHGKSGECTDNLQTETHDSEQPIHIKSLIEIRSAGPNKVLPNITINMSWVNKPHTWGLLFTKSLDFIQPLFSTGLPTTESPVTQTKSNTYTCRSQALFCLRKLRKGLNHI